MLSPLTKKQYDYPTVFQLYQHFKNPTRTSQAIFQITLKQLNIKTFDFATALSRIRDKGMLNLENFSLILLHSSPFEMASGLIQLQNSNLLNVENKKTLEKHACPSGVALVLRLLQSVKLLTSENRAAIQEKNDLHSIASVLFKLYYAGLFTQKNFDHVLAHSHLIPINNLLRGFDKHPILTPPIFEKLMHSPQEKISLCYDTNELKKLTPLSNLSKKISNLSIYSCGPASFFPIHQCKEDKKPQTKIAELNR